MNDDRDRSKADTQAGYRHRRSSHPPPRHAELAEQIDVSQQPVKTVTQHIADVQFEVRATRTEFITRQEAARDAIYKLNGKFDSLKATVDKLQFTVEGLRAAQDHAFKIIKDQQRKDRYVMVILVFCIFAWVVARSYRLVGV